MIQILNSKKKIMFISKIVLPYEFNSMNKQ